MPVADHQTCPSCGALVATDVGGFCPRCLLGNALAGETHADDLLADGTVLALGILPDTHRHVRAGENNEEPPAVRGLSSEVPARTDRSARLELSDEIGRGGMGVVLRGLDRDLGRELAVKVLRDSLRDNPEMVRRFVEEAQIAGQLQHPGIVPVHELGTLADDRPYFTMKLVKGRTLSKLLAEGMTSEADRAGILGIFEQICQTVAYAHAHGVIHRDLKPSNVMVGSFGEVQVMDWGLAKILRRGGATDDGSEVTTEKAIPETVIATARSLTDSDLSSAGSVLGTPSYMAPEQARGEVDAIDERADVFALGSILCEILSGLPAFTGAKSIDIQRRAADGDLSGAWLRLDGCGVDAELVDLARNCLAPERDGRPRDAGVVSGRLTVYLAGVQARLRAAEVARAAESARAEEATRTAEVARAQARAERRARQSMAGLAGAVVAVVALIGGGATWLQRQSALRAATTSHLVNDALAEATRREGEVHAGVGVDPSGWDAALAEARRAADLLKQGEADTALRNRVDAMLANLTRQRATAAAQAALVEGDRKLLADLDAAPTGAGGLDVVDRNYVAAFQSAGLDVDRTEPRAIGAWIAARPARSDLVVYLDDWAHVRRSISRTPGQHADTDLVAAARVADPDPWRDRLRAAQKDPTALRALADDEPGLETQPAKSLHLLAYALKDDGRDWERGARVLRLAWRRFPNDFWTNFEMSRFLEAKIAASPRAERARWNEDRMRFLAAAAAARPTSVQALYQLGDTLVESGRFEDALEAYRAATRRLRGTAPYTRLGQILRGKNKLNEAAAAFREAIRTRTDDAEAHSELGNLLRDTKKLDDSAVELREATRLEPTNAHFLRCFGHTLESQGKMQQAIDAYRESFRIESGQKVVSLAPYCLAQCLRRTGKTDEAIAVLEATLRIKPDEIGAHDFASDLLTERGRWAEALRHVSWLSERDSANPLAAAKVAILLLLSGHETGYQAQCNAMLDRFGEKLDFPALYAVQDCMLGTHPVAPERASRIVEEIFRRESAASSKPGHFGFTQFVMALAEYRNGRFDRAAELAKAVRGDGRRWEIAAEIIQAMASHRLGDETHARQELAAAARAVTAGFDTHDEWDAGWYDWLACDLLLREAKALIVGADPPANLSGAPIAAAVFEYPLVQILLRAGRVDEAIAVSREAALLKPDDPQAQMTLGQMLAERGRWEDALKALDKAAELDLTDDRLWLQVSTLHLYLGDDEGYRRYSLGMLDRFGLMDAAESDRARKSCLLSPKPVEFDRVYPLVKQRYEGVDASSPTADHHGWYQLDWALAEYRKGHFDRAADHLKRCRAAGGVCGLQAESLLSMTYQRLGLKAEAGRLLAACRKSLREIAGQASGWGFEWHDYLTCEMFCRETEALIRDDAARSAESKPPTTLPPAKMP